MRIASYNILKGGLGRLDPLAETLLVLGADLLFLAEAADPDGVAYLAKRLGHDAFFAESLQSDYHAALLSRLPLRRAVNLSLPSGGLERSALEAVVDLSGQPLCLIGCHLASGLGPERERRRLAELSAVLEDRAVDAMPTALVGDFNSHAPWHRVDIDAAPPDRRSRMREDPTLVTTDLVEAITGRGFIDVHHRLLGDRTPHTFTTGHPSTRFDFIFANRGLAELATDAGVERRGFAPYCSDHYPVWADFGV